MKRDLKVPERGAAGERPASRDLGQLRRLFGFVWPYRLQVAGALAALIVAAGTVLGLGFGLRKLVDEGFASGNVALLDQAVLVLFGVVLVLAGSSYARFYLVSWIGERVVADLRRAVFDRVITLSPAYYELTRTGEILSRLTTDTSVLQMVVGTSASIALRNILLLIGGTALLAVTSAEADRPGRSRGASRARPHPGLRPPGAPLEPGQSGPSRRRRGLYRRGARRDSHGAGLRPRADRPETVRRPSRGGLHDRAGPHPGARHTDRGGDRARVRGGQRHPVDRRSRRVGRAHYRR